MKRSRRLLPGPPLRIFSEPRLWNPIAGQGRGLGDTLTATLFGGLLISGAAAVVLAILWLTGVIGGAYVACSLLGFVVSTSIVAVGEAHCARMPGLLEEDSSTGQQLLALVARTETALQRCGNDATARVLALELHGSAKEALSLLSIAATSPQFPAPELTRHRALVAARLGEMKGAVEELEAYALTHQVLTASEERARTAATALEVRKDSLSSARTDLVQAHTIHQEALTELDALTGDSTPAPAKQLG